MYLNSNTKARIQITLDLYKIYCHSLIGKIILLLHRLTMIILPYDFADRSLKNSDFSFLYCLKFIGLFYISLLFLEFLTNCIVVVLMRIKE